MPVAEKALRAFDPAKLKISHADYAGKTPVEARKAIKKLLDNHSVVITTEKIDKARIEAILGTNAGGEKIPIPAYMQSSGQMEGMCMARAFYDGTDNSGAITAGKPVVIDTVTGNCVTGINSKWSPDEYKLVGVALEYLTTPSPKDDRRVMIRLSPPAAAAATDIGLFQTAAKLNPPTPYPPFESPPSGTAPVTIRRVYPAYRYANPDPTWSGTGNPGFTGGRGEDVEIYNTSPMARWVPEFTQLIGWKINDKWYCQFVPFPTIYGFLAEDMNLDQIGSYAKVQQSNLTSGTTINGMSVNEKVKNMAQRPGYKYPSGTPFLASLIGVEYVMIKAFQCPVPQ